MLPYTLPSCLSKLVNEVKHNPVPPQGDPMAGLGDIGAMGSVPAAPAAAPAMGMSSMGMMPQP
jgi:hypothetical protein